MKRFAAPLFLSLALVSASSQVLAEVTAEDFKRLESDIAALTESRDLVKAEIHKLRDEIATLRAENGKLKSDIGLAGKDNVSRDELKKVVEQIQEVDRKRAADGKVVHDQLEQIAKLASKPVVLPPVDEVKPPKLRAETTQKKNGTESVAKPTDDGPELPTEYYEHVVSEGETLGAIVAAYNKEHGLKVKQAHILKANPKLKDPKKLFVGMKLRIPAVK